MLQKLGWRSILQEKSVESFENLQKQEADHKYWEYIED